MKNAWIIVCLFSMLLCPGPATAAEALQPMTIQLNWVPNVQFAGVLLAKEQGWYAEAGIDLTVKGWEFGVSLVDNVLSGTAQIGVVEGDLLIKTAVAGSTLKAIAAIFQKTPFCLMSKTAQGIETPEHLAGKRVGINSAESEFMLKIVLAHQGLRFEDITPIQIGWDVQPLVDDEIDVYPAFMNNDPILLKEQGYDVTYMPAFQYGYDFYSSVYVVTETMLAEQPQLIQAFLEVTLRGWEAAFHDPAATAQLVVEQYDPDGSAQQQTESLKLFHTLATLGEGKKFLGMMQAQTWTKGIETLYEFQQIEHKVPAEDVFTVEFLEKIYFNK